MTASAPGSATASLRGCGRRGWRSMTSWWASIGSGCVLDGVMTKAPFGGAATGANPTDRGKRGTKRSTLCEGHGLPLAVVVAGANVPDMKLAAPRWMRSSWRDHSQPLRSRSICAWTQATTTISPAMRPSSAALLPTSVHAAKIAPTPGPRIRSSDHAAGPLSACTAGSIAHVDCWCAGRSSNAPIPPSCSWPAAPLLPAVRPHQGLPGFRISSKALASLWRNASMERFPAAAASASPSSTLKVV